MRSLIATKANKLVNHIDYHKIISAYNEEFERTGGKINNFKFYREVVLKYIPEYKRDNWYQFVRKFKTAAGLVLARKMGDTPMADEQKIIDGIVSNEIATQKGINAMLNLGSNTLLYIYEHPEELRKLSLKDRINLLTLAMKAQDSRIKAIKEVRDDSREQARFERAFNNAKYFL